MKPILFSTPMVQAILEDRKTKTRRVCNPQPVINLNDKRKVSIPVNRMHGMIDTLGFYSVEDYIKNKATYQPGDILYVQETWMVQSMSNFDKRIKVQFKAEPNKSLSVAFLTPDRYDLYLKYASKNGWQSPYFMPKEAARIFLRATNVKVELLQDITEDDAKKEGCCTFHEKIGDGKFEDVLEFDLTARDAFCELWQELNSKRGYGWDANPWVWVYTFERCEKPGGTE
jgi:hypothetical protein